MFLNKYMFAGIFVSISVRPCCIRMHHSAPFRHPADIRRTINGPVIANLVLSDLLFMVQSGQLQRVPDRPDD